MTGYAEAFRRSLTDPAGFWGDAAEAIDWDQRPMEILDSSGRRSTAGSLAAR